MTKGTTIAALALIGAMTGAIAIATSAQAFDAAKQEKCFGISLKGHNDCAAAGVHDCSGMSKVDFEAGSWKAVPIGTCSKMNVKGHKGVLTPA